MGAPPSLPRGASAMNLYIRLPRLLGLSVPLRGPLFFLLSVPSSLPSFLFRPSYCSVEGEFLFSSSLARSPFPGWGKRGSADPSTTSTSDPTCPETEGGRANTSETCTHQRAPQPRSLSASSSEGERALAASAAVGLCGGIAVVGRRRSRQFQSPQRAPPAAAPQRHSHTHNAFSRGIAGSVGTWYGTLLGHG